MKKVSLEEALEIADNIMKNAEKERFEVAMKEAEADACRYDVTINGDHADDSIIYPVIYQSSDKRMAIQKRKDGPICSRCRFFHQGQYHRECLAHSKVTYTTSPVDGEISRSYGYVSPETKNENFSCEEFKPMTFWQRIYRIFTL
jgi:hypothetical protein